MHIIIFLFKEKKDKQLNIFFTEQSDAANFTVAGRLQKKAQSPVELQFERSPDAAAKKCPLQIIRSANQPQLGLAKSASMMVTSSANGNVGPKTTNGAIFLQRSLSVNDENPNCASESNSPSSNSDSDNEKDQKDKRNLSNQTANQAHSPPSHDQILRGARVVVPKFDDEETFEKFFASKKTQNRSALDEESINIADFDKIKPTERYILFVSCLFFI